MIAYRESAYEVTPEKLRGFFAGWPNPPSLATHLRILQRADHVVLAVEEDGGQVVGYITALSDGILTAYIPHLEVLPAYQKQGIGSELLRRMLERLGGLYMIDLLCDPEVAPFYEKFGMRRARAMCVRNYGSQAGT
jgi:ribosomal protein S18 acetylase RimI-like enzyme